MRGKVIVGIVIGLVLALGARAWAQQGGHEHQSSGQTGQPGQPAPQGGAQPGPHGGSGGQPGPETGPGGMIMLQEGRAVLSKDQWQKFEAIAPRGGPTGPGMGRGRMMTGGQGRGIMGQMGSQPGMQCMSGMMMGGMGQGMMGPMAAQQGASESQSAMGGKGSGATRTDATGPVILTTTLQPVRGDRIPVEVKLDTHSVDLDAYQLEASVVLRSDRGESGPPVVESPAGSGHHRAATLAFPASLAGGAAKYLELVVWDLAGVKERVLRWNAPFPGR